MSDRDDAASGSGHETDENWDQHDHEDADSPTEPQDEDEGGALPDLDLWPHLTPGIAGEADGLP